MQMDTQAAPASKKILSSGHILNGLVVLMLLFDALGKFTKPVQVVDAFARLGLSMSLSVCIGTVLLVCTVLYAIPRTAVLGAVLLTGFLGGAVAIQMRVGSSLFETLFPVLFGALAWGALLLRDRRLRALMFHRS